MTNNADNTNLDDTNINLNLNEQKVQEGGLYPWECVSLLKKNGMTVDLQIRDTADLMTFLHVVYMNVYRPKDSGFLYMYRVLKFRMKLSYEAWMRQMKIPKLVERAIFITLL